MVAVKNSDVDRFIARPDPARPVILLFGPAGLVHERTETLIAAVDDPHDPFALARIDGDAGRRAGAAGGRGPYRRCSAAAARWGVESRQAHFTASVGVLAAPPGATAAS